jgi:hypothetical protein
VQIDIEWMLNFRTRHGLISLSLSLADFAATLAADDGASAIAVRKGNLEMEKYVATDARRSFDWPIHPEGF